MIVADASEEKFEVATAIDGKPDTGWGVSATIEDCFVQVTRTMPRSTHRSIPWGEQGTFKAIRRAVKAWSTPISCRR